MMYLKEWNQQGETRTSVSNGETSFRGEYDRYSLFFMRLSDGLISTKIGLLKS
jgi:hypothetical protein